MLYESKNTKYFHQIFVANKDTYLKYKQMWIYKRTRATTKNINE